VVLLLPGALALEPPAPTGQRLYLPPSPPPAHQRLALACVAASPLSCLLARSVSVAARGEVEGDGLRRLRSTHHPEGDTEREMEMEHGEEMMVVAAGEEEGWQTPRREDCRIPAAPPCPAAPPRKKAVTMAEAAGGSGGGRRRDPPKGGYFQPPDLESLFVLAPRRRQAASSCA